MLVSFEAQAKERCEAWGGRLLEVNGEADHIHLLLELPPTATLADFVNALKTGTSRRLRNEFRDHMASVYKKRVSGYSGGRTGLIEVPRSAWARWTIDCALHKYGFNSGLKVCTSTGSTVP